jgi:hypothetical protein
LEFANSQCKNLIKGYRFQDDDFILYFDERLQASHGLFAMKCEDQAIQPGQGSNKNNI